MQKSQHDAGFRGGAREFLSIKFQRKIIIFTPNSLSVNKKGPFIKTLKVYISAQLNIC